MSLHVESLVKAAFEQIVLETGFKKVGINRLVTAVKDCPLGEVLQALKDLCDKGVYVPVEGDWSRASAWDKATALWIGNKSYLFLMAW